MFYIIQASGFDSHVRNKPQEYG